MDKRALLTNSGRCRGELKATYHQIVAILGPPNIICMAGVTAEWAFGTTQSTGLVSAIWTTDDFPMACTRWKVGGAITPFLTLFPGMVGDFV